MTTTNRNIEVVVLCGGKGVRLQTVVSDRPKPMALFGDRPFLSMLLDYVAAQGFNRFILCAGYMAEFLESYFSSNRRDYEVTVYREETLLGTAGALRHVAGELRGEHLLVMNGDSFCALNYGHMVDSHIANRADATMVVARIDDRDDFGNVVVDGDRRIRSFREKQGDPGEGYVNAGVYLLKRSVVDSMERKSPLSLERDVFPGLINSRFFAYMTGSLLLDIGTPERYERAKKLLIAEMRKDTVTL